MRQAFICATIVATLSVFGFGCKDPDYRTSTNWRTSLAPLANEPATQQESSPAPAAKAPRPPDTERGPVPELVVPRQALENLRQASSFRAEFTFPQTEANARPSNGEIVYVRDQGMRGTINFDTKLRGELLIQGDRVRFRSNTSTWSDITNTDDGQMLKRFSQLAFQRGDVQQASISYEAVLVSIDEDRNENCRKYTYKEYVPATRSDETSVACIKDTFPVYVVHSFAEGDVVVHYSKINDITTL